MLRDVLGDHATDDLLNQINDIYCQLKILGWNEVRPWNNFFATFKPPQLELKHLEQRITTNFLYYRSNYAVMCGVILAIQILRAPVVFLTLLLLTAMCGYLLVVNKYNIRVGDIEINDTAKRIICGVVSVVLLAITGTLEQLVWTALFCILSCGLHMVFRPRNVTTKTNRIYEETKLAGNNYFNNSGSDSQSSRKSVRKTVFSGFESRYGQDTQQQQQIDPEDPPMAEDSPYTSSARSATAAYFPLSSAAARDTASFSTSESKYTGGGGGGSGLSAKMDNGVNYNYMPEGDFKQTDRPLSSSFASAKRD